MDLNDAFKLLNFSSLIPINFSGSDGGTSEGLALFRRNGASAVFIIGLNKVGLAGAGIVLNTLFCMVPIDVEALIST